jgi:hypothetical protein
MGLPDIVVNLPAVANNCLALVEFALEVVELLSWLSEALLPDASIAGLLAELLTICLLLTQSVVLGWLAVGLLSIGLLSVGLWLTEVLAISLLPVSLLSISWLSICLLSTVLRDLTVSTVAWVHFY